MRRQVFLRVGAIGGALLLIGAAVSCTSGGKSQASAQQEAQTSAPQVKGATIAQPSKGAAIRQQLQVTKVPSQFPGGLDLSLGGDAELLLTDSSGRRTGLDPLTRNSFSEISNARIVNDSIDDPSDTSGSPVNIESKALELSPVPAGRYSLTVTGTGTHSYDLEFTSFDPSYQTSQASVKGIPTAPGSRHIYAFTAPIPSGGAFPLSGGFDGGGEKAEDVNHLLTYANPISSETGVPAGTTTFPLLIFYNSRAIANSFSATLNGSSIREKFHPTPGGFERVDIPLHSGRNVLVLSIAGSLPDRVATDSDRLIFSLP